MKNQKILYGIIVALVMYILFFRSEKYTDKVEIDPNADVFEIVKKIEEAKKNKQ